MFRVDAFPFNDAVGAEETFWLAARSPDSRAGGARRTVADVASKRKGVRAGALYPHDNAAKLYWRQK